MSTRLLIILVSILEPNTDIWYHLLRDHAIKGDIVISHVGINDQLADIFTEPLDEK
jgi:hypothetical protein